MNVIRKANKAATLIFRIAVSVLLLASFYMILISMLVKPDWGTVSILLLTTSLSAVYGLGFGQQIENWFARNLID